MARISIYRPDGSKSSEINCTSREEAKAEVAALKAKMKAAGEGAKGWAVKVRYF